ncbi:hypothetical protein D918_07953 [Trichuris suis]|nr:hypothetical protein D918_07953 [Trichuris suis]
MASSKWPERSQNHLLHFLLTTNQHCLLSHVCRAQRLSHLQIRTTRPDLKLENRMQQHKTHPRHHQCCHLLWWSFLVVDHRRRRSSPQLTWKNYKQKEALHSRMSFA